MGTLPHAAQLWDRTGMEASAPVVRVRDLRKSYGSFEALGGISFDIRPGETFALLGPNGAGKSTAIEILEGYRDRSSGEVRVLGVDPQRAGRAWKARLGIVLQSTGESGNVTVTEQQQRAAHRHRRDHRDRWAGGAGSAGSVAGCRRGAA